MASFVQGLRSLVTRNACLKPLGQREVELVGGGAEPPQGSGELSRLGQHDQKMLEALQGIALGLFKTLSPKDVAALMQAVPELNQVPAGLNALRLALPPLQGLQSEYFKAGGVASYPDIDTVVEQLFVARQTEGPQTGVLAELDYVEKGEIFNHCLLRLLDAGRGADKKINFANAPGHWKAALCKWLKHPVYGLDHQKSRLFKLPVKVLQELADVVKDPYFNDMGNPVRVKISCVDGADNIRLDVQERKTVANSIRYAIEKNSIIYKVKNVERYLGDDYDGLPEEFKIISLLPFQKIKEMYEDLLKDKNSLLWSDFDVLAVVLKRELYLPEGRLKQVYGADLYGAFGVFLRGLWSSSNIDMSNCFYCDSPEYNNYCTESQSVRLRLTFFVRGIFHGFFYEYSDFSHRHKDDFVGLIKRFVSERDCYDLEMVFKWFSVKLDFSDKSDFSLYCELAKLTVQKSPGALLIVNKELDVSSRDNLVFYIVLARCAIEKDPNVFRYVGDKINISTSENLEAYVDLAKYAIEKDPNVFRYVGDKINISTSENLEAYVDLAKYAIEKDPNVFRYVGDNINISTSENLEAYVDLAKHALSSGANIPDALALVVDKIDFCNSGHLHNYYNIVNAALENDEAFIRSLPAKDFVKLFGFLLNDDGFKNNFENNIPSSKQTKLYRRWVKNSEKLGENTPNARLSAFRFLVHTLPKTSKHWSMPRWHHCSKAITFGLAVVAHVFAANILDILDFDVPSIDYLSNYAHDVDQASADLQDKEAYQRDMMSAFEEKYAYKGGENFDSYMNSVQNLLNRSEHDEALKQVMDMPYRDFISSDPSWMGTNRDFLERVLSYQDNPSKANYSDLRMESITYDFEEYLNSGNSFSVETQAAVQDCLAKQAVVFKNLDIYPPDYFEYPKDTFPFLIEMPDGDKSYPFMRQEIRKFIINPKLATEAAQKALDGAQDAYDAFVDKQHDILTTEAAVQAGSAAAVAANSNPGMEKNWLGKVFAWKRRWIGPFGAVGLASRLPELTTALRSEQTAHADTIRLCLLSSLSDVFANYPSSAENPIRMQHFQRQLQNFSEAIQAFNDLKIAPYVRAATLKDWAQLLLKQGDHQTLLPTVAADQEQQEGTIPILNRKTLQQHLIDVGKYHTAKRLGADLSALNTKQKWCAGLKAAWAGFKYGFNRVARYTYIWPALQATMVCWTHKDISWLQSYNLIYGAQESRKAHLWEKAATLPVLMGRSAGGSGQNQAPPMPQPVA